MNIKRLFSQKVEPVSAVVSAGRVTKELFSEGRPLSAEYKLYDSLRCNVPVIDAAISKTIRLVGGFKVISEKGYYQNELDEFIDNVQVGLTQTSLQSFIDGYLDSLLTYGNAFGQMIVNDNTFQIDGLITARPECIRVSEGVSPCCRVYDYIHENGDSERIQKPQYILYSALNPVTGSSEGVSILRGLPCISSVLMKIYECIGQNFDRVGNVRYAVTYKPSDSSDMSFAKERAELIAKEWSEGMNASRYGQIRDFVAVGDVDIKVIGADNQLIDTEIPVKQLLEQIVAKLSVPPFLLGLNWSTTERMSSQQADILTSELEYYRRILTPVIKKICMTYLKLLGCNTAIRVEWDSINLQDEVELSRARLYNAQAKLIENQLAEKSTD